MMKSFISGLFTLSILLIFPCASKGPSSSSKANFEIREGKKTLNGTKLFVRDVGPIGAPILVVVHGGPGGNHINQLRLERFATDFRVVFYDQRGTGESERLNISANDQNLLNRLSLEKNIKDIEELRKMLGRDKISLIGHSNGGALAVFYAAKYPEHVEKLIVYSGGPEDKKLANQKKLNHLSKMTKIEGIQFKEMVATLQERTKQGASQEELDELFTRVVTLMVPSLYREPPKGSMEIGHLGFWANAGLSKYIEAFDRTAFIPQLQKIKSPALLIWGRYEPAPAERLLYLLENIPNSRFVVFEKSGHNAMEEEPELFFKTLMEFVSDRPISTKTYHSRSDFK